MTYTLEPELPETATPKDYSRIHFDPSQVPPKRIVGLLACQRDPLLRQLTSKVVSSEPAKAVPVAQKGRQKKKSAANTPADTPGPSGTSTPVGKLWEVELEDTVVFPEGGGQPWDTGRMIVTDANGESHSYTIEGCVRRKLDAVHLVRVPENSPVAFDTLAGQDVTVDVDWEKRTDHMITHTAQHLLSAVLDAKELPTLSWGMGPHPTTEAPYIELPRGLTWAEAAQAEQECNDLIREARKVWIDVTMQENASGVSDPERASELERANRAIPKDYSGGVIRHCNIDGIDRNACCGTQCPDLSVIGFLHVLPPSAPWNATEPTSKVPTRLFFVAGPRAVNHLSLASRWLSQAGQAINVGRPMLVERITKIESNRFETAEREKSLKAELAQVVGENLAREPQPIKWLHRFLPSTHDNEFLGSVGTVYKDAHPDSVFVATSAVPSVTPVLVLVTAADDVKAKAVFEAIKTGLAGEDKGRIKGGGARGRYMAKVDGRWGKAEMEAMNKVVEAGL